MNGGNFAGRIRGTIARVMCAMAIVSLVAARIFLYAVLYLAPRVVHRLRHLSGRWGRPRRPRRHDTVAASEADFTILAEPDFDLACDAIERARSQAGDRILVVAWDRDHAERLRRSGIDAHWFHKFPGVDLHCENAFYERSHAFVEWISGELAGLTYRGAPIAEILKQALTTRDVLVRRAAAVLRQARAQGRIVFWIGEVAPDNFQGLVPLARSLGFARARLVRADGTAVDRTLHRPRDRTDAAFFGLPGAAVAILRFLDACDHYLLHVMLSRLPRRTDLRGRRPVLVVAQADPSSIYWKALRPVLQELVRRGHPTIVVTGGASSALMAGHLGPTPVLVGHSRVQRGTAAHREVMDRLQAKMREWCEATNGVPPDPESRATLLTLRHSEPFRQAVLHALRTVDLASALIRSTSPRCVLLAPHFTALAYPFGAVARQHRILRVSAPAATVAPGHRSIVHWDVDLIAAYGTQCVEAFTRMGYPERMLIPTGNAGWDALHGLDPEKSRARLARRHGLRSGRRMILVATSRVDPHEERWLRPMLDHCRRRGDVQIVVKVHPGYHRAEYEKVGEPRRSPIYRILDRASLPDLIAAAEAVVTDCSSAGVEAALVGTPLIVVNLLGAPYPWNNYDERGLAILVTRTEQIAGAMDLVLDDAETREALARGRKEFARRANHRNDGRAAERICDLLTAVDPLSCRPVGEGEGPSRRVFA
jgi:glycosyltransferase involved in cell wall biosynthesis